MTNNDILRRLRYALQINDSQVAAIFAHTGQEVTRTEVANWLKGEGDGASEELLDVALCNFLDGLIIERRGVRPDGRVPEPLKVLSRNEILRKLRIAFEFRDEDMTAVFEKVEFVVTKAELSSFFRKEGHRNYRKCPEQVLRKFIQGLSQDVENESS